MSRLRRSADAPHGTHTRTARRCTSPTASDSSHDAEVRSRRFGRVTSSTSSRTKSTGTAQPQTVHGPRRHAGSGRARSGRHLARPRHRRGVRTDSQRGDGAAPARTRGDPVDATGRRRGSARLRTRSRCTLRLVPKGRRDHQSSVLANAWMSAASRSGSSCGAKCPPRSKRIYRTTL
jgi:hypothetical protein